MLTITTDNISDFKKNIKQVTNQGYNYYAQQQTINIKIRFHTLPLKCFLFIFFKKLIFLFSKDAYHKIFISYK